MYEVDDELGVLGGRGGQDAVPEIEDVPPSGGARSVEDAAHPFLENGLWQEEARGVEVALQRDRVAGAAAGLRKRHAPIHTDHVGPRPAEDAEKLAGLDS